MCSGLRGAAVGVGGHSSTVTPTVAVPQPGFTASQRRPTDTPTEGPPTPATRPPCQVCRRPGLRFLSLSATPAAHQNAGH